MKRLIIGLGTGRCGTVSLSYFLNDQPNIKILHEGYTEEKHHLIKWYDDDATLLSWIKTLDNQSKDTEYYGDIGMYFLPYVPLLIEQFPTVKFICLKRNKTEVIKSYLEYTQGRNHWVDHDGTVWNKDHHWDVCYPKFTEPDKAKALGLYWDMYYAEIERLQEQYPHFIGCFDTLELNSDNGQNKILDFIEYQGERQISNLYWENKNISTKLKGFPPVYYISLDDKTARQESIEQQFKNYGIQNYIRISAFDGRNSDLREILVGEYPSLGISPQEIGCTTSHLKAIDYWLQNSSSDYAFICEDDLDLSLVEYWNFTWSEFVSQLPQDWDCIQLAVINHHIRQIAIPFHERYDYDWSTSCYLINRKYAEKLISTYKLGEKYNLSLTHFKAVADSLIYLNGKTYTINLFSYKNEFESDIQGSKIVVCNELTNTAVWQWWEKNGRKTELKTLMTSYLNKPPVSDFLMEDSHWLEVLTFLNSYTDRLDAILAPTEFMEFFAGVYHYSISSVLPADHFKFIVFHKGMVDRVKFSFLLTVTQSWRIVFANPVFVIYTQIPYLKLLSDQEVHIPPFLEQVQTLKEEQPIVTQPDQFAITITTNNRPDCLRRSLPQLVALGVPIIVIDYSSTQRNYQANQEIVDRYQVPLLRLPKTTNGHAIFTGINYWLADPDVTWISYFQDNVDVHPNTLKILAQIQDSQKRPLLTGYHASNHPTLAVEEIVGYPVRCKRSTPSIHLHAYRDYWNSILPIPLQYSQQNGVEWITHYSPNSIIKKGGYVTCIPQLVQEF